MSEKVTVNTHQDYTHTHAQTQGSTIDYILLLPSSFQQTLGEFLLYAKRLI